MYVLVLTTIALSFLQFTARAEIESGWPRPAQALDEAADEVHDAEILRAVLSSMEQWTKKKNHTRIKRSQPTSVCYDKLGCFEDSGPFGYLEMLPSSPQEINTRFLLYSTKSRGDIPLLDVPFGNMSEAWRWADRAFNSSSPTKVIVHGFGSNCDHVWVYEMRSALMAVEECNVICVDWEAGALIPNYVRAAANTRLVGKQLAMLLEGLADHINLKYDNVHLIGFSLGAHVAGFAGSQIKNVSRITGLDPAGPLFEAQDPRARLDSSDANFVDVIHSNGENLILGGLGSWQPMGHVDFYPNGGRMQTGCSNLFVGAVTDIIWSSAVEGRSLCNHRRAYKFFTDSVSPKCHFPSFPCETYEDFLAGNCFGCNGDKRCGNMGYYADRSTGRGQLYLLTREEEPFCAHQYHVRVESSRQNNQSVVSYGRILLALVGDSGLNETFPMTRKDDAELTVGGVLSRMLVPHPALGVPIQVQLQYQAYSGWISSGLNRWTIDKVLLSDSFGKMSSICKKGLVLNSGTPVLLPLYPGNCNHPTNTSDDNLNSTVENNNDKRANEVIKTISRPFIPTEVIKIGDEVINDAEFKVEKLKSSQIKREDVFTASPHDKTTIDYSKSETEVKEEPKDKPNVIPMGQHFRIDEENNTADPLLSLFDATEILNLPWQPLLANTLDNTPNERESGRAFGSINTKYHNFPFSRSSITLQNENSSSEIVEPILRLPSNKNARSHDLNKLKNEITEPILGSTTVKSETGHGHKNKLTHGRTNRARKPLLDSSAEGTGVVETSVENAFPERRYNESLAWNQISPNNRSSKNNRTRKSNDVNKKPSKNDETYSLFQWQNQDNDEPALQINNSTDSSFTVQFLPSRLVSFLEKAERYARNTLLPLVSAYTPKFLFFGQDRQPAEPSQPAKTKYIPLQERLNTSQLVPELAQEDKIKLVKKITPPNPAETNHAESKREFTDDNPPIGTDTNAEIENNPIKIVKGPDMVTTGLPPVMLPAGENSSDKIIIVYPTNARDDRKIQSHTFSEIMQFESLYQQSLNKKTDGRSAKLDYEDELYPDEKGKPIRIDLPTYKPPTEAPTPYPYVKPYSTTPKFIPVSYPSESQASS